MKIFIICSKQFYGVVPEIKTELEKRGHTILLPNCINDPSAEQHSIESGAAAHVEFKQRMYRQSESMMQAADAVLVLNLQKDGVDGYIGGATFLEMHDAFRYNKPIYLFQKAAHSILSDEIDGFGPIVINGDLSLLEES